MDIDIKEIIKAAAEGFNLKDFKSDLVAVKIVENEIGNVEEGGIGIQNVYSNNKSKKAKTKKTIEKKHSAKPKTLKYYTHGNNGVLMKQRKRVDIVFKKFIEWKWIDEKTNPKDFDAFFEGEPWYCNIKWTGNSTILTILLQELIKQSYIKQQTGCAAKSLVVQQFGKTANSDRSRLDNGAEEKISAVLYILDIRNPLDIRGEGENELKAETVDDSLISVYAELFEGQLRSTKGI